MESEKKQDKKQPAATGRLIQNEWKITIQDAVFKSWLIKIWPVHLRNHLCEQIQLND